MLIKEMYPPFKLTQTVSHTFLGRDGQEIIETEEVLVEHMIEVFINGKLTMKLVCIPENLAEMVLGRLLSEGIIKNSDDVEALTIDESGTRADVFLTSEVNSSKLVTPIQTSQTSALSKGSNSLNYKNQTTGSDSQSSDCDSQSPDCDSLPSDCDSQSSDCNSQSSDCNSQSSDCDSQSSDCDSLPSDCDSLPSDCDSQSSDFVEITPSACTSNHILNDYFVKYKDTPVLTSIPWKKKWIFALADKFAAGMPIHSKTWSTHSAFLAMDDQILFECEDIGRHNALDKAIGYAIRNNIDLKKCILYSSGRIPTDMVMKVIHAGVPILASKASLTGEAVELARKYNLTLICAARRDRMKLYVGRAPEENQ